MHPLRNHVLIILGMHRSGTSALTGGLHYLGAELGTKLLPPQEDNQWGFWEHARAVEINDRLLRRLGSSWDDVRGLPANWWLDEGLRDFRDEIAALLVEDFAGAALWAIKDPRMCRVLPLWEQMLAKMECTPHFIVTARNPVEVTASLVKRDGFDAAKGYALWLDHMLAAEFFSRGKSRCFVNFDELLASGTKAFEKIADRLRITWPRALTEARADLENFLRTDRKHHSVPLDSAPVWAREAYTAFVTAATRDQNPETALDAVRGEFREAQNLFGSQLGRARGDFEKRLAEAQEFSQWQEGIFRRKTEVLDAKLRKSEQRQKTAKENAEERKARLQNVESELRAVRSSWAWKVAKPFRIWEATMRKKPELRFEKPPAEKKSAKKKSDSVAAAQTDVKQAFTASSLAALRCFLASGFRLTFSTGALPEVSVLLVLHNRAELTYACLQSLLETRRVSYEVILVDNASSDDTGALLSRIDGAKILRNKTNEHFLNGCNQAAQLAQGRYLLFLNNDARLLTGTLETALQRIRADESIGAIGGKIILLDGSLQEAGSIVWQNGVCLGYGRGGDPMAPEFQFERDVDYCSGAFLVTPRELFLKDGGFSPEFRPAYYEETDYCLRLWEQGQRVVYDPRIAILHYEFASSGTTANALELQRKNRATFTARHAEFLSKQLPESRDPVQILKARSHAAGTFPRNVPDLGRLGEPSLPVSRAHSSANSSEQNRRILLVDDRVPHRSLGS